MIDFRSLSYFLVACEHRNLGAAAQEIGIAPSTLSASLKTLEADLGVSLFYRKGAGLSPRHLGHWLYRGAVPLLLLEAFARRRVVSGDVPAVRLQLNIQLPFAFGHFRRALARALADSAQDEPLLLIDPRWPLEAGAAFGKAGFDCLGFDETHELTLDSVARPADPAAGETELCEDPWMLVRRQLGVQELHKDGLDLSVQPLMVPAFAPLLVSQITSHIEALRAIAQISDAAPGDLPQLLEDHPGVAFLYPASAVAIRSFGSRTDVTAVNPSISSTIIGRSDGHSVARRFLARLKQALSHDGPAPAFEPVLTERRIRYFNLAYELGRVSAAARAASVAQPALSQQLHKLEESLGTPLFDRCTFGLVRTDTSVRFALAANLLDKRLRELEISGATAALAEGGRISLGVLPSVSHHGHLVNRITEAMLELGERYPAMSITVHEAPNGTLQNWVLRGRVGLAIVETALSQMPRLALDASEELAVIVNTRHGLIPPGPIRLADLASIPLALPTTLFGLRQLLDAAARELDVKIQPKHQIDALTMLIALLAREPIATVLPASAVRPEILSGELSAHPIIEPAINRRLFVIYSGDRSLTPAERDLVRLLRDNLARNTEPAASPEPLAFVAG